MDSIVRLLFRQIEELLRLSKTSMHAFQLQFDLSHLFDNDQHQSCAFSYDLRPESHQIRIHLHATCFRLQRALFRLQASRQMRDDVTLKFDQSIIDEYETYLSKELKSIQRLIFKTREEKASESVTLTTLQDLFRRIEENLKILMEFLTSRSKQSTAAYLGNVISDTLEQFYSIHATLTRVIVEIEENEKKNKTIIND